MALDIENTLSAEQHGELLGLTRRWAMTFPGDRRWVEELIRGRLWGWLKDHVKDRQQAIEEFVENLAVERSSLGVETAPKTVIPQNYARGVGDKIERLAMKTDGGLSRAAFHLAFADSLPEIKEIVDILEPKEEPRPDWTVEPTEEMEEWVRIYDLEWLPFEQLDQFAMEHGWTIDEPVHRLASRKFGSYGNGEIVAVQESDGVYFYVYRDHNPETPYNYDMTNEIYYKAPDILGSN